MDAINFVLHSWITDEPVSCNFDEASICATSRSETSSVYDIHVRALTDNYVRRNDNKKKQQQNSLLHLQGIKQHQTRILA
jgi:hypothetical protein